MPTRSVSCGAMYLALAHLERAIGAHCSHEEWTAIRKGHEMDENPKATGRAILLRALRSTTGRESTTFGFSILVTVCFGLMQAADGAPTVLEIFLYAAGAVMSFTVLTGLLSRGFRRTMPQHRTETLALGTSMNIISVGIGMGAVLLLTAVLDGPVAWALAPFAGTSLYLLAESLEVAAAERLLVAQGDSDADEVSS
jgi:hypothetical protein